MAKLYHETIVEYRLPDGSYRTPDGKRVTKKTPGAVQTVRESAKWYGRYMSAEGKPIRVPLSESKEISRRMFNKIRGDSELARVGIADPFAEHREKPLSEHIEDFRRYLAAKDGCPKHVRQVATQATAVVEGCDFLGIDDLQPSAVAEYLAELRAGQGPAIRLTRDAYTANDIARFLKVRVASVWRMHRRGQLPTQGEGRGRSFGRAAVEAILSRRRGGIGVSTSNHYLGAIKHFSKWLMKDRRAPYDALASLSQLNTELDPRHVRRTLEPAAFAAFLAAAKKGRPFRGLSGLDRAMVYTCAAYTGLRASELGSLTPGSFDLDADQPAVTVEAAYSKHRRKDVLALRADLAERLRAYLEGRARDKQVWPGSWTIAGAEMVRIDLEAAGIPYIDRDGLFYDFHALRHQFVSDLAKAGVHPKVAQELARHSDIRLTMNTYTHMGLRDHVAALDKLPPLPGGTPIIERKADRA